MKEKKEIQKWYIGRVECYKNGGRERTIERKKEESDHCN